MSTILVAGHVSVETQPDVPILGCGRGVVWELKCEEMRSIGDAERNGVWSNDGNVVASPALLGRCSQAMDRHGVPVCERVRSSWRLPSAP